MKRSCQYASAIVLALITAPNCAQAQTMPPPSGNWHSTTSATRLVVSGQGCALYAYDHVQVAGKCSWNGGTRGGILTITYPMPLEPGHVRYAIIWVDRNMITVFGEPFRRQ